MDEPEQEESLDLDVHPELILSDVPNRLFVLYEVEFKLEKYTLLCIFSRVYIQDVDLYNLCLDGTDYSQIVPTNQTIKLLLEWIADKYEIAGSGDHRQSPESDHSSSSAEETEEQMMRRQMGLPGIFGETKIKKQKRKELRNDVEEFFQLISNLGYYGYMDYHQPKKSKSNKKTLCLADIKDFKYRYKSERSARTPRYRFVSRKPKKGNSTETTEEDLTEGDATAMCHSPGSSTSETSIGENTEIDDPKMGNSDVIRFNKADMDFDFGFDPERDANLMTSNFFQQFSNDKRIIKYWHQRFRLFSKLNEGILMDCEGWFSVTPERIAHHIAKRMVTRPETVVLDAFTGVGGNAIQFALQGALVYAIDLDPIKIRCARRNAEIYGVLDRITFICGDFFKVAESLLGSRKRTKKTIPRPDQSPYGIDAIFLSPPWGGPAYESKEFDIQSSMGGLDGIKVFRLAERISANIGYFLPRNTPSCQIIALANNFHKVEIEQSFLNGKNKTITAFYGNLVRSCS